MSRSSSVARGCLTPAVIVLPIMLFLAIWRLLSPDQPSMPEVAFSDFVAYLAADREQAPYVEAAHFQGREITFWVKDPRAGTKMRRRTVGPASTDDLGREIAAKGVVVTFEEPEEAPRWQGWALLGLLLGLFLAVGLLVRRGVRAREEIAGLKGEVARLEAALKERAQG